MGCGKCTSGCCWLQPTNAGLGRFWYRSCSAHRDGGEVPLEPRGVHREGAALWAGTAGVPTLPAALQLLREEVGASDTQAVVAWVELWAGRFQAEAIEPLSLKLHGV